MSVVVMLQAAGGMSHPSADEFGKLDPTGFGMTIVAMGVVFAGLAFLYLFYKMTGRFFVKGIQRPRMLRKRKAEEGDVKMEEDETSGDEIAAIGVALYLYSLEMQDWENAVLTIKKVARNYSPWSSKIYGTRPFEK